MRGGGAEVAEMVVYGVFMIEEVQPLLMTPWPLKGWGYLGTAGPGVGGRGAPYERGTPVGLFRGS
jgi:hypothetical protein